MAKRVPKGQPSSGYVVMAVAVSKRCKGGRQAALATVRYLGYKTSREWSGGNMHKFFQGEFEEYDMGPGMNKVEFEDYSPGVQIWYAKRATKRAVAKRKAFMKSQEKKHGR